MCMCPGTVFPRIVAGASDFFRPCRLLYETKLLIEARLIIIGDLYYI